MRGSALALLWALSAGTLALRDIETTPDTTQIFHSRDEGQTLGDAEPLYAEEEGLSLFLPAANNKLWLPGLQEPEAHPHEWKDKRGECIEDEPCPIGCEDGMACLHKNCSNHSECEGALKCCKTLCGKRCMLPEFKLPCESDRNCPESTSCCFDGSCDSDCPIQLTATIIQQYRTTLPPVDGSGDLPSSVLSMTHNNKDSQTTTEESNQPHSPTDESRNDLTTMENGNYHK